MLINYTYILLFIIALYLPTIDSARGLARKALQQEMNGALDDAEVNYKRALKSTTSLYQAQFNLGNNLFLQERYQEALSYYQKLTSSQDVPLDLKAQAFHNAGLTYLQLHRFEDSKAALFQSLQLLPNDSTALHSLSYVLTISAKAKSDSTDSSKANNQGKPEEVDKRTSDTDKQNGREDKNEMATKNEDLSAEQLLTAQELNEQKIHEKLKLKVSGSKNRGVTKDW